MKRYMKKHCVAKFRCDWCMIYIYMKFSYICPTLNLHLSHILPISVLYYTLYICIVFFCSYQSIDFVHDFKPRVHHFVIFIRIFFFVKKLLYINIYLPNHLLYEEICSLSSSCLSCSYYYSSLFFPATYKI